MSYLIDGEQMTTPEPVKKRDHKGEKNPHYNCPMSQKSRNAIAASQRARYDYYRKATANIMTEERVREIIKDTIDSYLAKNIETKNNRPNNIPL